MTVHTAFTGFSELEPGAMVFLESDTSLAIGDMLVVTLAQMAETRLTVLAMQPGGLTVTEEGRAEPWTLELTQHGLSDFPILIIPLPIDAAHPIDRHRYSSQRLGIEGE